MLRPGHNVFLRSAGTRVVAIAAALAGAQRHARAAGRALGQAGQQGGVAHHSWRHPTRAPGVQAGLHLLELLAADQRRHGDGDPLFRRLGPPGARFPPIEVVGARIGRGRENPMYRRDMERLPPISGTRCVQLVHDRLHAFGHASATEGEIVDAAHDHHFGVIDHQHLLDLGAALLGRVRLVTERRHRAIPESLPGVFLHRAQRVLAVLAALVLVE
jgi:hypothetical protein